jgi:HK97 family phage major capsid protein
MSAKDIPTADDIKNNPYLKNDGQRLVAIRTSIEDRLSEMQGITNATEVAGAWRASDRKAFDKHSDEMRTLELLGDTIKADMPDLSQVVQTSTGEQRGGYDNQARTGREQLTYGPHDPQRSWVQDLRHMVSSNDPAASARLQRNNKEVATENRALASNLAGAVGEFSPPQWLMQELITVARPARIWADNVNLRPLPAGVNTVNIPRLATGTSVGVQTTENSQVTNVDATSDSISSTVVTLSGMQTLSFQLLDQSPVSVDQIILADLAQDLAVQTDKFALSSNAAGKYGVLSQSGTIAVTYTDTTPTPGELYSKLADCIQRIATQRFLPATKIVMHPRRWNWFLAALDSQQRPLVLPEANHPMNAMANQAGVVAAGYSGTLLGLPVFTDANIPVNLGSGTNEDRIIVCKHDDLYLWESTPRVVADRYTLANQLSLRLVLWNYVAQTNARYLASTAIIAGSGLATPTF